MVSQFTDSFLTLLCVVLHSMSPRELSGMHIRNNKHRLELAKTYVKQNIDDPSMRLETISQSIHISERTLIRMFSEIGTTPMRWVWKTRIEAAHTEIMSGAFARLTDVAFRFGFKDTAHFSRLFKRNYGYPPSKTPRGLWGI